MNMAPAMDREHWWREKFLSWHLKRNPWFAWAWLGKAPGIKPRRTKLEIDASRMAFFLYEAHARLKGSHLFGAAVPKLSRWALEVICAPFSPGSGCLADRQDGTPAKWRKVLDYDPGEAVWVEDQRKRNMRGTVNVRFMDSKTGKLARKRATINLNCSVRTIRSALEKRKGDIGLPAGLSMNRIMRRVAEMKKEMAVAQYADRRRRQHIPWQWLEWLDERATPERFLDTKKAPTKQILASRRYELERTIKGLLTDSGCEWEELARLVPPEKLRFSNT